MRSLWRPSRQRSARATETRERRVSTYAHSDGDGGKRRSAFDADGGGVEWAGGRTDAEVGRGEEGVRLPPRFDSSL